MSFFDRIRKGLGIGDTTIAVTAPSEVASDAGQIECDTVVTSGSPQRVNGFTASFVRVVEWEEATETYLPSSGSTMTSWSPAFAGAALGSVTDSTVVTLGEKESRTLHAVIPFPLITAEHRVPTLPHANLDAQRYEFEQQIAQDRTMTRSAVVDRRGGRVYFQVGVTVTLEDAKDKQDSTVVTVVTAASATDPDSPAIPPPDYLPPAAS